MPTYFGKMREPNAEELMPAMVTVERGTIRLVSGQTPLGEWKMQQVVLRDRGDGEVSFQADGDEIVLVLKEHDDFLAETGTTQRQAREERRGYVHPAFRKEDSEIGPGLGEELRRDVIKEATGVADEIKELGRLLTRSQGLLWGTVAVLVLLVIFVPAVVVGIGLGGGLLLLIVGAIAYADDNLAVKIPDPLTPVTLIAAGVVLVVLGLVVALIR